MANFLQTVLRNHAPHFINLAMLSDITRLFVLYVHGGIYADVNDRFCHNHKENGNYCVVKMPSTDFFQLPFGFAISLHLVPEYYNNTKVHEKLENFYSALEQPNAMLVKPPKGLRVNNDFLAAEASNDFLFFTLESMSRELTVIKKLLFKRVTEETIQEVITTTGPTFINKKIKAYLKQKKLADKYQYYFYFPIDFIEYYFKNYTPSDLTWLGSKVLQTKSDRMRCSARIIWQAYKRRKAETLIEQS